MSKILGVPLDAAYYVVTSLAGALTPLTGALSVALAIVLFTIAVRLVLLPFSYYALRGQLAQARLAPQIQALRQQHRRNPERLNQEVRALYRANGTGMFAGYLPLLLQWPFLTVMYLLFRSATINGAPNSLLRHHLFGALLSAHWLSGPGPLSLQGAVFAAVFVLLALAAYLSARLNRRLFPRPTPSTNFTGPTSTKRPAAIKRPTASTRPAPSKRASAPRSLNTPKSTSSPGSLNTPQDTSIPKRTSTPKTSSNAPATSIAMPSWLTNALPLVTVVFAAFLPLAGGLYLLTTTTWTLLERRLLAHHVRQAPTPPAPAVKTPARAA
jgi:YidC/Oxa1 family membrane protein insertase